MFIQHIGATGLQNITDGDESYISCVEFTVYGFTGSMVPQCVQMTDGPTAGLLAVPPVYFNAGYTNANTGVSYAAGTPITADGRYIIDTTGAKFALNVTNAGDGDFYVYGKPLAGPAPSFAAGSGEAVTIVDGGDAALGSTTDAAVTNPASAGTLIALTKGLLTAPTTPLPTSVNDATGTQTAAVKAASTAPLATDPALVTAISPNNWIANSATPANAALALPVYSVTTAKNSGVQQPVSTAGRVGAGDTGNNSMSVGCVRWSSSTTWDPETGNTAVTLLASASRTTTQTSADLVNYNSRALHVILDTTVIGTGSVTVTINGKDPVSGKYYPLLVGAAVITNVTNVYKVGLGFANTANVSANDFVPRIFQIVVTANLANAVTYSVGYNLLS